MIHNTSKNEQSNFFLGCDYKVNVRFNFGSRQTQAGMQVSSAILFCVSLFNRFTIEISLSQLTNMGSTFSVHSLLSGDNCPVVPPGSGLGYPSIISKSLP